MYVLQSNEAIVKINSLCKCIYGAKTVLVFAYDSAQDWKNPEEAGIHSGQNERVVLLMPLGYAAEASKPNPKWHYESKEIVNTVKYL